MDIRSLFAYSLSVCSVKPAVRAKIVKNTGDWKWSTYRANENLSVGLIRSGIFLKAIEFTEKLYRNPNCKEVKVYMLKPYLALTNKYGEEHEEQVGKLVLRRTVANKINWENITNDMFERTLRKKGQLWLRPVLGN